jgi:hypothetical protein
VFFAAGDDGSRSLPVKIGGRYHIPGRLEYADKTVMRKLVNTSAPLLRAGGQSRKYILSPLLRYLTKPCCDDKLHLTNRSEKKKFIKNMAARMRDMKDEIKDLVFGKRIRAFKVLSSNLLLLEGADEQEQAQSLTTLWDEDPVYLVEEKYEVLVSALIERAKTETFTNTQSVTHSKMPNSSSPKKGIPQHLQRQSWVTEETPTPTATMDSQADGVGAEEEDEEAVEAMEATEAVPEDGPTNTGETRTATHPTEM